MLARVKAAISNRTQQAYKLKMQGIIQMQLDSHEAIESVRKGIFDAHQKSTELVLSVGKEDSTILQEVIDENMESKLKEVDYYKEKIEMDIIAIEKAKANRQFKPVEALLKSERKESSAAKFISQSPRKIKWSGNSSSFESVLAKSEEAITQAFFQPFYDLLGKRKGNKSTP